MHGRASRAAYGPPSNTSEGWEVLDHHSSSPRPSSLTINPSAAPSTRNKPHMPPRDGVRYSVPSRVVEDLLTEQRMKNTDTGLSLGMSDIDLFADDNDSANGWGTDSPSNLLGNDDEDLDFDDEEPVKEEPLKETTQPVPIVLPTIPVVATLAPGSDCLSPVAPDGAFGSELDFGDDEEEEDSSSEAMFNATETKENETDAALSHTQEQWNWKDNHEEMHETFLPSQSIEQVPVTHDEVHAPVTSMLDLSDVGVEDNAWGSTDDLSLSSSPRSDRLSVHDGNWNEPEVPVNITGEDEDSEAEATPLPAIESSHIGAASVHDEPKSPIEHDTRSFTEMHHDASEATASLEHEQHITREIHQVVHEENRSHFEQESHFQSQAHEIIHDEPKVEFDTQNLTEEHEVTPYSASPSTEDTMINDKDATFHTEQPSFALSHEPASFVSAAIENFEEPSSAWSEDDSLDINDSEDDAQTSTYFNHDAPSVATTEVRVEEQRAEEEEPHVSQNIVNDEAHVSEIPLDKPAAVAVESEASSAQFEAEKYEHPGHEQGESQHTDDLEYNMASKAEPEYEQPKETSDSNDVQDFTQSYLVPQEGTFDIQTSIFEHPQFNVNDEDEPFSEEWGWNDEEESTSVEESRPEVVQEVLESAPASTEAYQVEETIPIENIPNEEHDAPRNSPQLHFHQVPEPEEVVPVELCSYIGSSPYERDHATENTLQEDNEKPIEEHSVQTYEQEHDRAIHTEHNISQTSLHWGTDGHEQSPRSFASTNLEIADASVVAHPTDETWISERDQTAPSTFYEEPSNVQWEMESPRQFNAVSMEDPSQVHDHHTLSATLHRDSELETELSAASWSDAQHDSQVHDGHVKYDHEEFVENVEPVDIVDSTYHVEESHFTSTVDAEPPAAALFAAPHEPLEPFEPVDIVDSKHHVEESHFTSTTHTEPPAAALFGAPNEPLETFDSTTNFTSEADYHAEFTNETSTEVPFAQEHSSSHFEKYHVEHRVQSEAAWTNECTDVPNAPSVTSPSSEAADVDELFSNTPDAFGFGSSQDFSSFGEAPGFSSNSTAYPSTDPHSAVHDNVAAADELFSGVSDDTFGESSHQGHFEQNEFGYHDQSNLHYTPQADSLFDGQANSFPQSNEFGQPNHYESAQYAEQSQFGYHGHSNMEPTPEDQTTFEHQANDFSQPIASEQQYPHYETHDYAKQDDIAAYGDSEPATHQMNEFSASDASQLFGHDQSQNTFEDHNDGYSNYHEEANAPAFEAQQSYAQPSEPQYTHVPTSQNEHSQPKLISSDVHTKYEETTAYDVPWNAQSPTTTPITQGHSFEPPRSNKSVTMIPRSLPPPLNTSTTPQVGASSTYSVRTESYSDIPEYPDYHSSLSGTSAPTAPTPPAPTPFAPTPSAPVSSAPAPTPAPVGKPGLRVEVSDDEDDEDVPMADSLFSPTNGTEITFAACDEGSTLFSSPPSFGGPATGFPSEPASVATAPAAFTESAEGSMDAADLFQSTPDTSGFSSSFGASDPFHQPAANFTNDVQNQPNEQMFNANVADGPSFGDSPSDPFAQQPSYPGFDAPSPFAAHPTNAFSSYQSAPTDNSAFSQQQTQSFTPQNAPVAATAATFNQRALPQQGISQRQVPQQSYSQPAVAAPQPTLPVPLPSLSQQPNLPNPTLPRPMAPTPYQAPAYPSPYAQQTPYVPRLEPQPQQYEQPRAMPMPTASVPSYQTKSSYEQPTTFKPQKSKAPHIFVPKPQPTTTPSFEQPAPQISRALKKQYQPSPKPFVPHVAHQVPTTPTPQPTQKYKDPRVLPPSCLVTFGFGGTVAAMFPKRKLKLNHYSRNSPRPQGYQTSYEEPVDDGDLRKGPIVFYTMDQVHPKDALMQRIQAFPGPLSQPSTTDDAILKYLHSQAEQTTGDDKLLWELFEVFVKTRGRIATRDAQAPEILLMQVLQNAQARRQATTYDVATLPFHPTPDQHQAAANQMRQLLLAGDRRAAIDVAKSANLWPQAMLIASFVDPEVYKSVVHSFVTSQYVASDPMRSLFLLFGDLEEKCVQEPVALNAAAVTTPSSSPLLTNWLAHVLMWIANPTKDTNAALVGLGDRLLKEANMVSAAHICYMLSGATLEAPSPASRLVLVGGNHNDARSFVCPTSIHLSEIVEYTLKPAQQIPFQGYKFIYASLLADLGMCDLAYKYVDSMRKQLDNWQQKQKLSPYLETVRMQVDVLEDRLKLHLGQDRAEAATVKESKGFFSSLREKLDKSLDAIVNDTPVQAVPTQSRHSGPEFPQHLFPPAPGSGSRTPLQQAPGSGQGINYGPNSGHPPSSYQGPNSGHPNSSHGMAPLHPPAPASNGAPNVSNYGPGSNPGVAPSLPPKVPHSEPSHAPLHRSHSFTQDKKPSEPTQIKRAATTDEVPKQQEPSPSKEKAKAKTPPPSNTGSSRGWRWLPNLGIKDYLTSKLEPTGDAKVAKLGDKMEAYYDEKLKRWVFPKGEGEEEVEEPPSAPPTSFPATTHSAPASQATDDPLAALMAPPSRNTGPASQDGNALSSMMAPPARSNLYGSQRGSQRTLNRKPSRPQYAVFKPSPSTATEDVPPESS